MSSPVGELSYWKALAEVRKNDSDTLAYGKVPNSENGLNLLQDKIAAHPVRAMLIYAVAWLVWTLSYTAAISFYPDDTFSVHLAPHVAYLSAFLGFILFPPILWWYPMVLFSGLFAATLVSPYMLRLGVTGEGFYYSAVAFGANLFFAMLFGRMGYQLSKNESNLTKTGLSRDTLLVTFPFVSVVVAAIGTFGIVDTIAHYVFVFGNWASDENHYLEMAFVAFRGVRGGLIGVFLLVLCTSQIQTRDIRNAAIFAPAFMVAAGLDIFGLLVYPELVFSVILLTISLVASATSIALLGLSGAILFAMSTGTFLVTSSDITNDALFAEAVSTVLVMLAGLVLVQKLSYRNTKQELEAALHKVEAIRHLAGVGRFFFDRTDGTLRIDEAASRITGLPVETSLRHLSRSLSAESYEEISDALMSQTQSPQLIQIELATKDCEETRAVKMFVWSNKTPNLMRSDCHGYFVPVSSSVADAIASDETSSEPQKREATNQHRHGLVSDIAEDLTAAVAEMCDLLGTLSDKEVIPDLNVRVSETRWKLVSSFNNLRLMIVPFNSAPVQKTPTRPSELLEQVAAEHNRLLPNKDFAVTVLPIAKHDTHQMLDASRMTQILGELLRNAARHSSGSGAWLSYAQETDAKNQAWSVWIVEDDGRGLPEDKVSNRFSGDFHAEGQAAPRPFKGIGIRAARASVEELGGTLRYFAGIRGGARLEIRLPLEPARQTATSKPDTHDVAPQHWAIYEGSPSEGQRLTLMLSSLVRKISFHESLSGGLTMVDQKRPDVILCDLDAQDRDAIVRNMEAVRRFWPNTRIIGMTANVSTDLPDVLFERVISKPATEANLRSILDHTDSSLAKSA